jgi:hypothetical protein
MSAVLHQLLESNAEQKRAADRTFYDIARRIASGSDDPELHEVTAALANASKTESDLTAAVRKHRTRDNYRAVIGSYSDVVSEKPEIEHQIAAADSALEEAKLTHRQTVWPLQSRLREINDLALQAASAKQDLQRDCPCTETMASLKSVRFKLEMIGRDIEEKSNLIARQKTAIAVNKHNGHDTSLMEGRMAEANAELFGLRARQTALLADERDIMQTMIER